MRLFSSPASLIPRGRFEWLVLLWLTLAAASTLASVSPIRSLLGEAQTREGFITIAALVILALAARRAHRHAGDCERTLDWFLVTSAVTAAYALVQHAGLDPIAWANPSQYPSGSALFLRPAGTLGSAIQLGVVLVPALTLTSARLVARPEHLRLFAPLAALLAAALLATLSRGAWLAAALGVSIAVAMAAHGHWARPAATVRALALAFIPALLWGVIVLGAPILSRLTEGGDPAATSGPARLEIARAALAIAGAHPLTGGGPDTFGLLFPQFQSAAYALHAWVGLPADAHSALLQLLATGGLLAVILMLVIAFVLLQRMHAGATRNMTGSALTAATLGLAAVACIEPLGLAGAALLAVLVGLLCREPAESPAPAGVDGPPMVAWFGALILLAAASIALSGSLRANVAAGLARTVLERPGATTAELNQGIAAAEAAMWTSPLDDIHARLSSDLRLALARRQKQARDSIGADLNAQASLFAAQRAVQIEPLRAAAHQRVGSAEAMLATGTELDSASQSHRTEARAAFTRALRLAPRDPLLLVETSRVALTLRDGPWALAAADTLLGLSPRSGTAWALRASALLLLGRTEAARVALVTATSSEWESGSERERATVALALRTLGTPSSNLSGAQGSKPATPARTAH